MINMMMTIMDVDAISSRLKSYPLYMNPIEMVAMTTQTHHNICKIFIGQISTSVFRIVARYASRCEMLL